MIKIVAAQLQPYTYFIILLSSILNPNRTCTYNTVTRSNNRSQVDPVLLIVSSTRNRAPSMPQLNPFSVQRESGAIKIKCQYIRDILVTDKPVIGLIKKRVEIF